MTWVMLVIAMTLKIDANSPGAQKKQRSEEKIAEHKPTMSITYFNRSVYFNHMERFIDDKNGKMILYLTTIFFETPDDSAIYVLDLRNNVLEPLNFPNNTGMEPCVTDVKMGIILIALLSCDQKLLFLTGDGGKSMKSHVFKSEVKNIVFHPTISKYLALVMFNGEV
ncbi:hypothetical protein RF11_00048 [Thelohanellus kitauei]|uniref:Uncharacterized protein n=1 Tax=Thelohanellus kitauei TaxID=669202 RepID=A0A0C2NJ70_THEKT|nr:hypothetical protein RF11_00048 [Thelohanellus kitauei]